ncbi:class I SAM-dependent methyltransferase [Sorangium sp. So ce118]
MSSKIATLFNSSLAVHALLLAEQLGLLRLLEPGTPVAVERVQSEAGALWPTWRASIVALRDAGLLAWTESTVALDVPQEELGAALPVLNLWSRAYAGMLARGIVQEARKQGDMVAEYSAQVGRRCVDPELLPVFAGLDLRGGIGDLGCGAGVRLLRLCSELRLPGLGVDIDPEAIAQARRNLARSAALRAPVSFELGDAMSLQGVYPEIELVMMTFFTHHVTRDDQLAATFSSYQQIFPNFRYLVVFDTVRASSVRQKNEFFAKGFEYIHGVQNIPLRTYESYESVFRKARLEVVRRVELGVENSYIWVCRHGARG